MNFKELYLSINGRIGRKTYWLYCVLPLMIASLIFTAIDVFADLNGILFLIFNLLIIYPSVCITGKRWHDRNKKAWWILIGLIPIVGPIWALVENGFLKGTAGENRFGPDPLQKPQ